MATLSLTDFQVTTRLGFFSTLVINMYIMGVIFLIAMVYSVDSFRVHPSILLLEQKAVWWARTESAADFRDEPLLHRHLNVRVCAQTRSTHQCHMILWTNRDCSLGWCHRRVELLKFLPPSSSERTSGCHLLSAVRHVADMVLGKARVSTLNSHQWSKC